MVHIPLTSRRRAFTITEMLVTVGVIVVLASILVAALSQAGRAAQKGKTVFLMSSIKDGLVRFKADHGYLPPILGSNGTNEGSVGYGRDLLGLPGDSNSLQGYYSLTSLPEYLLGYDDRRMDGYGYVAGSAGLLPPDDSEPGYREHPGLGMRSPGPDGYWNATLNPRMGSGGSGFVFANRNPGNLGTLSLYNTTQMPGRVYGPYIDLKDSTVLGEVEGIEYLADSDGNTIQAWDRVVLPGDDGYGANNRPKVFVDYWGNPIRFYRKPPQNISTPDINSGFSLGDVISLRPTSYDSGMDVESNKEDANQDASTSRALLSAEFALFSTGPDGRSVDNKRFDEVNGYNADNIVEIGP